MAVEVNNFQQQVIEKSHEIPVLVDFWAAWCQPCLMLGPILDRVANKYAGKFILAKLNVDQYPQISAQYGIRGIPAVKLFYKGEIIAQFTGVRPEYEVERWLLTHLPKDANASNIDMEAVEREFNKNNFKKALELVGDELNKLSTIWQIRLLFFNGYFEQVKELLPELEAENYILKENLTELLKYLLQEKELPKDNTEAYIKMTEAMQEIKKSNWEKALEILIDTVMFYKDYANELPRKSALAILNLLGIKNELNKKYKRRLEMAIF